jgi:hypothetical protein
MRKKNIFFMNIHWRQNQEYYKQIIISYTNKHLAI